ncbi:hypothetical protein Cni_G15028 [Canna indica]|uniref:Late embryogenesis abundant protein n=1 Tax=Canna indica TaxID=4628 RepID=A0AAQ3KIT9_9LILI|nr:hypothetical protein Cni_G15028 [Canna indica]
MQTAKEKVKDMGSATKEKVKQFAGKAEAKTEAATAGTPEERAAAEERAKAREKEAKAEYHEEKAAHRDESAAHRGAATTHVPLTSYHHDRRVGADPAYPAAGTRPAGEKYL